MGRQNMASKSYINSIIRAIDLLELYSHSDTELGISEMARRLGLYKSMVSRIVSTLESKGILEKNVQTGKYKLGLKLYKLGLLARDESELVSISMPHLKALTDQTGETSNLVVMDGSQSMYVAQQEGRHMVRMFTRLGAKVLPHCTAAGKVLLAHMDKEKLRAVIEANGLPRFTEKTITTADALMQELEKIRRSGYSVDDREREPGVMCIAAPVKNAAGDVVAALSVSGPADRLGIGMDNFISYVIKHADDISGQLGYNGSEGK
jgi:IclR family KDG regulon transcriptional repressor